MVDSYWNEVKYVTFYKWFSRRKRIKVLTAPKCQVYKEPRDISSLSDWLKNLTAVLQKEQIQLLFLPTQIDYSTKKKKNKENKPPNPTLKNNHPKTTLDVYNLLAYGELNPHIEKVVFCTEGKLLHQISDLLWAI